MGASGWTVRAAEFCHRAQGLTCALLSSQAELEMLLMQ